MLSIHLHNHKLIKMRWLKPFHITTLQYSPSDNLTISSFKTNNILTLPVMHIIKYTLTMFLYFHTI